MRRRLVVAIFIIASSLGLLAWLDVQLLLRNPTELDARVRLLLARVFPTQRPELKHVEVDLPNTRCIIEGFSLSEKSDAKKEMLRVDRVEISFSLSDWLSPREITVQGVTAKVRRDKHGNVNLLEGFKSSSTGPAQPAAAGPSKPISSSAVLVQVSNVNVSIEDEESGIRVLSTCPGAQVTLHPDGSITGAGKAQLGALVTNDSPFAASGRPIEDGSDLRYCEVVPFLGFEVDRRPDGRVALPLHAEQVRVGPLLRSILPPYVQNVIWDELNPTGLVDARVTLRIANAASAGLGWGIPIDPTLVLRPEVYIHAKGATLRPKGFPYPIRDISGRFEVAPGIIAWEDVTAQLNGEGSVTKGRGSFFLGENTEKVTLFVSLSADKVPFDESLRAAMPADIRQVYDQFLIRGASGPSRLIVFKGPFMDDPQISIRSELNGKQSAAFTDYPVRFTPLRGSFTLKEGGNVEIDASGRLEGGGTANVEARVVHGDLIHVHVDGEGVPVGSELLAKIDPDVRRMIQPFRPTSGKVGFEATVEKADPKAEPLPHVIVHLDEVEVTPDQFPYTLKAGGRVEITPRAATNSEPAHVRVDLAVTANGPAVTAAVVSGTVLLDPRSDGEFQGELEASARRVDLVREVKMACPGELQQVFERLQPQGAVESVTARLRSLKSFEAAGSGRDLTAALDAFPYRVHVDSFSIAREGRTIELRRVDGRTGGYGRFGLAGNLELAPEGGDGPAEPLVQVSVQARDVPLEPSLIAALPGDARTQLAKLDPRGRIDADLSVDLVPALPPDITGTVSIAGARMNLDRLDPALEGLQGEPVEGLDGTVRLDGERVWIDGLRGRFRNSPVSVAGYVTMGERAAPVASDASAPSAPTLDLVSHVDGLLLDETSRKLARGPVLTALNRFPVEGRCDLDFRFQRANDENLVDVRVRPRGVHVVPKLLPFGFEDVRGTIEVSGGEPVYVELSARLGTAEVSVRHDERTETFAAEGASVYRVRAKGLTPQELLSGSAPEDFATMIRDMDLQGTVDLAVDVAVPPDERGRQRFLAELRTRSTREHQGLSVTSGLRFEEIQGVLRVAGSVAKFEPLRMEGAMTLQRATWKKQEIKDAVFPVSLRDGIVSIGTNANYFVATVYGGQLRGSVDTDLKTGAYSGRLFLENAQLQQTANELMRLGEGEKKNEPKSGGTKPIRGQFVAKLDFRGGGVSPDGQPIGISGDGQVRADHANLVEVPVLLGTLPEIVSGVARGDSSYDPKSFDRLYAKIRLKPTNVALELVRLDSDTLTLAGRDGRMGWDGDLKLDLLPFKTGNIFDDVFKQFVGVSVRGTVSKPSIQTLPFSNSVVRLWDSVKDLFSTKEPDRVGESVPDSK